MPVANRCRYIPSLGTLPGFLAGLAPSQVAYEKPWAMKGIFLQFQVLFLHAQPDLADDARSLLQAGHLRSARRVLSP
jgi:hypothetical protein